MYKSLCCDAGAKKEPCVRSAADVKQKKFSQSTLGKWHCTGCGKSCKVKAVKDGNN